MTDETAQREDAARPPAAAAPGPPQAGLPTVLREWGASHPGYHLNQQTFAVEPDPKPKPEAPKKP